MPYYKSSFQDERVVKGCVHYIFASFVLSVNESTYQTTGSVFYSTLKALSVLEKIKF